VDWLATAFHWLMRTGLPNFSPLQLIELRIAGSLFEWDFSISYFLERFKHVDYYLVYSTYANDFKTLEDKGRSKQLLIYNNLKGLSTNSFDDYFIGRLSNMLELPSSLEIFCLSGYGSFDFDKRFENCANLKRLCVRGGINAYYLHLERPLPNTIKRLEFSLNPQYAKDRKFAVEHLTLNNITRLKVSTEVLQYLDVSRLPKLNDLVVCNDHDAFEHRYKYERESKILRQMLTALNIPRLEFNGRAYRMSSLIDNLVSSGTDYLFIYVQSLSIITRVVGYNVLSELVVRCPHLRFLAVECDELVKNIRVAKAAINTCRAVLEIYIGHGQNFLLGWNSDDLSSEDYKKMCDQFSLQWKSFVLNYGMPPVLMHPYDPCGDIVLDSQSMCRLDVPRLGGFRDNEWAKMLSDAQYFWDDGTSESE
jgi:hypothetical protein